MRKCFQLYFVGGRGGETVPLTLKLIKWDRSIGLPTLTWRDQKNGRDKSGVIIPAKDDEEFSRDVMFLYANSEMINLYEFMLEAASEDQAEKLELLCDIAFNIDAHVISELTRSGRLRPIVYC